VKLKIRELRVGDGVDLHTFPAGYDFDQATLDLAEFQYAEMSADFEVESDTTWVLHTEVGSFGVDPDWEVEVHRL
jgi:hypothetical protein